MAKGGRAANELETALAREKQDRADAEDRERRANERAREADEAYRKLQLALVAAQDEAATATEEHKKVQEKLEAIERDLKTLREAAAAAAAPPPKPWKAPSAEAVTAQLEEALGRIQGLRELLATASVELSQLHADEVLLSKKRTRVLSDACALLQRAVGTTGQAPPPIPSAALEARLSMSPVVDISEVADLIESLRPPGAPKV